MLRRQGRFVYYGMVIALIITMHKFFLRLALMAFAFVASPAFAIGDVQQVPEASAVTLFALGVLGVIIGRRGSMRSRDSSKDVDDK